MSRQDELLGEVEAAREIVAELLASQKDGHTLTRARAEACAHRGRCVCRWCRAHRFVDGDDPEGLLLPGESVTHRMRQLRDEIRRNCVRIDKRDGGTMNLIPEESHIEGLRRYIEEMYDQRPTHCGVSFGELLCYEIHSKNRTFVELAAYWSITVGTLGELITDHCKRMEPMPRFATEER